MKIYTLMFILCTALAFFSERKRKTVMLEGGETVTKPNLFFLILSAVPVIFFAGMRGSVADTGAYIITFKDMTKDKITDMLKNVSDNKDVGFKLFTYIVKSIFNDYTVWLFIIAIFSVWCIWRTFYKRSDSVTFSIYLFFGTTAFSWLFNGMRQYIVISAMFAMFPLLIKTGNKRRDLLNFLIFTAVTLVLSTFHLTALIAYFIFLLCAGGDILSRSQALFIFLFVGASAFAKPFTAFIEEIFSDTQYANIGTDFETYAGASIFRFIIAAIPAFLGLYRIKYARQLKDPVFNFCYNMSLMNVCFMVPAVIISGNTFGRMAEYFATFNLVLYPMITNRLYSGKTRKILNVIIICIYAFWFYYQMKLTFNWGYTSPVLGTFK